MPSQITVDPGEMVASWFSGGQLQICRVRQGEFEPTETAEHCTRRFLDKLNQMLVDHPKDNG